jgi:hypothetical protein
VGAHELGFIRRHIRDKRRPGRPQLAKVMGHVELASFKPGIRR